MPFDQGKGLGFQRCRDRHLASFASDWKQVRGSRSSTHKHGNGPSVEMIFFNKHIKRGDLWVRALPRVLEQVQVNWCLVSQQNLLHPLRCMQKRDTSVPRDTREVRAERLSGRFRLRSRIALYRLNHSQVEAYTTGFSQTTTQSP